MRRPARRWRRWRLIRQLPGCRRDQSRRRTRPTAGQPAASYSSRTTPDEDFWAAACGCRRSVCARARRTRRRRAASQGRPGDAYEEPRYHRLVVHAVAGAQGCVDGLLDLHDAPNADDVLGFDRTVFLPPVRDADELHAAAVPPARRGSRKLGRVSYAVDEALSAAVGSFPSRSTARGRGPPAPAALPTLWFEMARPSRDLAVYQRR